MKKKVCIFITLFFLVLSNLSFGLVSFFSFVCGTVNYSLSDYDFNVEQQYNLIVSLPKDFVNMCIKLTEDFKKINTKSDNVLYLRQNVINSFENILFATLSNPLKLKTFYIYGKKIPLINIAFKNGFFILLTIIFMFYMLRYIGLLRLFNSYNYNVEYFEKLALSN